MPSHNATKSPLILLLAGLLSACVGVPTANAAPATTPRTTVEGELDKSAVREVVRAHIDEVRECYNAELAEDETIEGHSVIAFEIQPDGSVLGAAITESSMPERFDACLTGVVEGWSFPASDAETRVSYPFNFSVG
jgi:TonB family protein